MVSTQNPDIPKVIIMKFKTRLYITFVTIVMLPLALTSVAFFGIGMYLLNVQKGLPFARLEYLDVTKNMQEIAEKTDKAYFVLRSQAKQDP